VVRAKKDAWFYFPFRCMRDEQVDMLVDVERESWDVF
jgi:hypothetical protein